MQFEEGICHGSVSREIGLMYTRVLDNIRLLLFLLHYLACPIPYIQEICLNGNPFLLPVFYPIWKPVNLLLGYGNIAPTTLAHQAMSSTG